MICKLCLQEKTLCDSHIIPEFFYKLVYDKKPRKFVEFSTDSNIGQIAHQKGLREKLLCKDCEGKFSEYEKYVKELLFDAAWIEKRDNFPGIIVQNVDYRKVKLFQMSLLWRVGVSSLLAFNNIKLAHHEEKIRKMLLEGNPGKSYEYGCILFANPSKIDILEHTIFSPIFSDKRIDGHRCCIMLLAGIFWTYFISSHLNRFTLGNCFLSESGELPIIYECERIEKYVWQFLKDVGIIK
jgi:hypothetical protein